MVLYKVIIGRVWEELKYWWDLLGFGGNINFLGLEERVFKNYYFMLNK